MSLSRWGYELLIDARSALPYTIRCPKHISNFTETLVKEINMEAYGKPQLIMFGEGNKKGYTLMQPITTSLISAHFCEETNDFYMNIFSCRPFKEEVARRVVQEFFSPADLNTFYVERDAQKKIVRLE